MLKFIKITASDYNTLISTGTINEDYFYLITDTNEFYLGTKHLTDQDLSNYLTSVEAKNNSINVSDNKKIEVKISSKNDNALLINNTIGEEGLYAKEGSTYTFSQDPLNKSIINFTSSDKYNATSIDTSQKISNFNNIFTTKPGFLNSVKKTFVDKNWGKPCTLSSKYIWSDGEHIYYSQKGNAVQTQNYEFDKNTGSLTEKTWNGLTTFSGEYIWTDGENTYYSAESVQKVLDKETSTWNDKVWNNQPGELFGNAIWTDGEDIYCSDQSWGFLLPYKLNKETSTWEEIEWDYSGYSEIDASGIWTDGENIYYTNYAGKTYRFYKTQLLWTEVTLSGLDIKLIGKNVWYNEDKVYYSNEGQNYIFNKENLTWIKVPELDRYVFKGEYMWSDGENLYNMEFPTIYKFNKNTKSWIEFNFTSAPSQIYNLSNRTFNLDMRNKIWKIDNKMYLFNISIDTLSADRVDCILDNTTNKWYRINTGNTNSGSIWTDGENIYKSGGGSSSQYIFNKDIQKWESKTWNGYTNIAGANIWTDGENIYYSAGSAPSKQVDYVLDRETSTWTQKTWNYDSSINWQYIEGKSIWTDGVNIYCTPTHISPTSQKTLILDKDTSTWSKVTTWINGPLDINGFTLKGQNMWTDGINIYHSSGTDHRMYDRITQTWSDVDMDNLSFYGDTVWSDGEYIYISTVYFDKEMTNQILTSNNIINQQNTIQDLLIKENNKKINDINIKIGDINNVLSQLTSAGGNS